MKNTSIINAIKQLETAIKLMEDANKALASNNLECLISLGFEEEYIKKLVEKHEVNGYGFPDYSIKNNKNNIELLKLVLQKLDKLS